MLLKLLLLLSPFLLFSAEVVWDSQQENIIKDEKYNNIIKQYIEKLYTTKVKRWNLRNKPYKYIIIANGLMWENGPIEHKSSNWRYANSYCNMLSLENFYVWRLPTLKELKSILVKSNSSNSILSYNIFKKNTKKALVVEKLSFLKPESYWTSELDYMLLRPSIARRAIYIDLSNGYYATDSLNGSNHFVCVRSLE